ncbi:hypothetical protein HN014_01040 [Aquimarina sp. TRL1]|uniref:hypothetical protein n=1 Tax=Aquimarina sp. (strain TRL1) TaxID=2736252 RepID=UPI00158CF0AC|nr:hypothetical protein [Aquimarina sp. TRL1]QKX03555.1 hypothetical protein HN014_01040 [Aquimarina sp. TRL1]
MSTTKMHTTDATPIALGVLGIHSGTVFQANFRETALPVYQTPIRVGVEVEDFSSRTYKAYLQQVKKEQEVINYVDSISDKPTFLQLRLLDHITAISALQKEANQETISYLKTQKNTGIVSTVSMVITASLQDEITKAEAVFLTNSQYKQYTLSLAKQGKIYKTIDFSKATIFGYSLSYFCWGQNDKNQISIFSLTEENRSCPKNTYKDAGKAAEKINYLKL